MGSRDHDHIYGIYVYGYERTFTITNTNTSMTTSTIRDHESRLPQLNVARSRWFRLAAGQFGKHLHDSNQHLSATREFLC